MSALPGVVNGQLCSPLLCTPLLSESQGASDPSAAWGGVCYTRPLQAPRALLCPHGLLLGFSASGMSLAAVSLCRARQKTDGGV